MRQLPKDLVCLILSVFLVWGTNWLCNLPYGAQRRLEIARALANHPKLLLLDEPTAGMNPQETEEMTYFIKNLRDELTDHHPPD